MNVPPLGPPPPMTPPPTAERTLDSGLRVIAVRRTGVPLAEVRLRIPFGSVEPGHAARGRLLAETLLAGTDRYDRMAVAERVQELGATLSCAVDPDMVLISGVVHTRYLDDLLGLVTHLLEDAAYPDEEVDAERERLLQRLRMARSSAAVHARETLHRHLYGDHPYGSDLPEVADVAAVVADDLRALHARRVTPAGSVLILVGDLELDPTLTRAAAILGSWTRPGPPADPLPSAPPLEPDPSLLVHRPGSVQSSVRIGGPALRRDDPRYPALQLTNLLYGGYFSSRLVANIREDKGYTYSPRSKIDHSCAGSTLVVEADVATEVTAPALLEMWYELGRLSTLRPTDQELDDVRQYAIGTLAMSIANQSGLANTLVALVGVGLDLNWVRDHPARLAAVTAADVYEIGVHILAPCRLAAVVIGDADQAAEPLKAFGPWEVRYP
jgi:predicted Zn-dependent peptidase